MMPTDTEPNTLIYALLLAVTCCSAMPCDMMSASYHTLYLMLRAALCHPPHMSRATAAMRRAISQRVILTMTPPLNA